MKVAYFKSCKDDFLIRCQYKSVFVCVWLGAWGGGVHLSYVVMESL